MCMPVLKCLIIGSGPAGYTAAIYAARAGLNPFVYTGEEIGGQLMLTTEVENYPGYPQGVSGPAMMEDLKNQAERFGAKIVYETVGQVDFTGAIHKVWTESREEILTHTIIISTGASAKWLNIASEKRLMNKGVSACAVCDGYFFKGKEVAVVGGGDTAAEESTYLSKLCSKVHLLIRKDRMKASKFMQQRVLNTKNIIIHWHTQTIEILGKEEVEGVCVLNIEKNSQEVIPIQGFFVAIGHKPNTDLFKGQIRMDITDYIYTIPGTAKTNIAGIFASGDVMDKVYRQAITAAGTGCMAALDSERYLIEKGIL